MTDKEVTQRAEGAKVAADVGSTGSSFTAYLVECLPSINKQRLNSTIAMLVDTAHHVYGCERTRLWRREKYTTTY